MMPIQAWILLLMLPITVCTVKSQDAVPDVEEYCEFDVRFNPKCTNKDVILIKYARYGRMRTGRCITPNSGQMGCSMDVRSILDGRCMGRRTCDVIITSIPPKTNPPCPIQLRGYLEVAYQCVQVVAPSKGYCQPNDVTEVREEHGYLSNLITRETECGSPESPWWIAAKPGQRLNFRLLNYDRKESTSNLLRTKYAIIKWKGERPSQVDITRERPLYSSVTNRVEVIMAAGNTNEETEYFMLEFNVFGCPDLTAPTHGWSRRVGNVTNVGCNDTTQSPTRTVKCVNKAWVGEVGSCVPGLGTQIVAVTEPSKDEDWSFLTEANALAITAGIGAVILIGICLLVIGLVYICRQWKRTREPSSHPTTESQSRKHHERVTRRSLVKDADCDCDHQSEMDYYGTWQMSRQKYESGKASDDLSSLEGMPLPPPPPPYTQSCDSGAHRTSTADDDHIYERPIFASGDGERDSKYYDLDPDLVEASRGLSGLERC